MANIVQHPAKEFSLQCLDGKTIRKISSKDLNGQYYVIAFYPLDFTFICPTEIFSMNELAPEFHKNNCKVFMCSVDSEFSHLAWTQMKKEDGGLGGPMSFPILADLGGHLAKAYNVYSDIDNHSLRAVVIVSDKGIVRHFSCQDPPSGRNFDETLRLVMAYQYADSHGDEVCPAKWAPGQKSIIATPEGKLAWFRS